MKTLGTNIPAGVRRSSETAARSGPRRPNRLARVVGRQLFASSAGVLGVALLLTSSTAPNIASAGNGGTSDEVVDFQLVRRVTKVTTTTTAPTASTTSTTVPATTSTTVLATTSTRLATFETGNFSQLDMNQANNGSITVGTSTAASGAWSAKATVNGGVLAQYGRVGYSGPWNAGEQVVYKASFRFPTGFFSTLTNQMDLMRFDNWDDRPTAAEQTGLTINVSGAGKQLYLFRNQLGSGGAGITYIAGPFALPSENVWHQIEVRQVLSSISGSASNALYVNGVLQGSSTQANMFGATGNRYNWFRAGIVASGTAQTLPISLYMDNLSLGRS